MFRRTARIVMAKALVGDLVECLLTRPAAALLVTPTVTLFTAGSAPTPGSAVADFTECTTNGIAPTAVTLTGPFNAVDDNQVMKGTVTFIVTAGGTLNPETVIGYIVSDGVTAYYGGEVFLQPVPFAAIGDFLELDVIFPALCAPQFSV